MNLCRICMENGNGNLVPIFSRLEEAFIANIIVDCASVEILEDDGLPTHVCAACIEDLKGASLFVKKCRDSDRKLRKMFKTEIEILPVSVDVPLISELEEFPCVKQEMVYESEEDFDKLSEDDNYVPDFQNEESETENEDKITANVKFVQVKKIKNKKIELDDSEEEEDAEQMSEVKDEDDTEDSDITIKAVSVTGHACCSCLKLFDTKTELKVHGGKYHSKKRKINTSKEHVCSVCYRRYASESALKAHEKLMGTLKHFFECSKCGSRFIERKRANYHKRNHPTTKVPVDTKIIQETVFGKLCCAQACGKSFETDEQLIKHAHTTHEINKIVDDAVKNAKPVECNICFKRFNSEISKERHQRRNYKHQSHQCVLCGLKFRSAAVLTVHERTHTGERPFACDKCTKKFYSKEALKAHQMTHSELKPYVCSECGWAFVRKKNWQVHCLTHTDDFPFKCTMCPGKFKSKPPLQYHMRTHTGERPYKCRYCEKAFADHTNRHRHEMSHTGIKPYKCSYCDKTFIRKRFQVEHESTHTGIKPYRCDICSRMFSQKISMKKHLESHPEYRQAMMMNPQPPTD